jgi:hypothetical protein
METQLETILTWAHERGYMRGEHDRFSDVTNEAPLSGEWAGESPQELLGDLFAHATALTADFPDNTGEIFTEIMDSYEQGYEAGNREVGA